MIQLDEDDEAEIVFASDGTVAAFEHDGSPLWTREVWPGASNASPPCAADFDGDGQTELGVAMRERLVMLEPDGQVRWSVPVQDESSAAGCARAG